LHHWLLVPDDNHRLKSMLLIKEPSFTVGLLTPWPTKRARRAVP